MVVILLVCMIEGLADAGISYSVVWIGSSFWRRTLHFEFAPLSKIRPAETKTAWHLPTVETVSK